MTPERLEELKLLHIGSITDQSSRTKWIVESSRGLGELIEEVERLGKYRVDIEAIAEAVNKSCTCTPGVNPPGEGCPACEVWHTIKRMRPK